MRSQSTDTQGVLEAAFLDELSKIAEAQKEDDQWITKGKLKRLLGITVPATAIGAGGGYVAAKGVEALYRKHRRGLTGKLVNAVGLQRIKKYGPMVGGALGLASGALAALQRKKSKEVWEGKHERSK